MHRIVQNAPRTCVVNLGEIWEICARDVLLEGVCATYGADEGTLAQRLKQLSDSGQLDKRLFEWTDAMRLVGNEAAHDVKITVSREDASDLLDLAEAVAEYLYTIKEKFESFSKRRAGKASGHGVSDEPLKTPRYGEA